MTSPSMVQRSGDTLIVRSVVSGDRLYLDATGRPREESDGPGSPAALSDLPVSGELSDSGSPAVEECVDDAEAVNLPQCKIRRNYDCGDCEYFTQNPRDYLTHLRDVHGEKVKIYDCPHCLYASKHFQKLLRHKKMVHNVCKGSQVGEKRKSKAPPPILDEFDLQEKSDPDMQQDEPVAPKKSPKEELQCSLCEFTANSQNQLSRHERKEHLKTKFFPCSKCNYVTHIKARFTKHVKYHSMPMIKCEVCDFRTPYKWNLDRHMKNHGGTGAFCCSACDFTADIRQSLTVHEMNHHVPAVGVRAGNATGSVGGVGPMRRRNRVGGSDSHPPGVPVRARHRTRLHPRNKLKSEKKNTSNTEPTILDSQNELSELCLSVQNANEYDTDISNCNNQVDYKDNGSIDESNYFMNGSVNNDKSPKMDWFGEMQSDDYSQKSLVKKTPRPIPNLIPLQATSHVQKSAQPNPLNLSLISKNSMLIDNLPLDNKDKTQLPQLNKLDMHYYDDSTDHTHMDHLSTRGSDESSQQSSPAKNIPKKKNSSIFDKLYKEKFMTASAENGNLVCKDCGHLSKSVSEHTLHEKMCNNVDSQLNQTNILSAGLRSTRCQYCRHRCKSSSDLVNHLQTCLLAGKDRESPVENYKVDKIEMPILPMSEEEASVDDPQVPHPMENVVFVWNAMLQKSDSMESIPRNGSPTLRDNLDMSKQYNKLSTSTPNHAETEIIHTGKKVFKCPHCSFWASTASRFHVHIVGHLNKKPFECSLCSYKSNWRWDITKHIRLKSVRDPDHSKARVLMTDETGRRNYSKYNKYLTLMQTADSTLDAGASGMRKFRENNNSNNFESNNSLQSDSLSEDINMNSMDSNFQYYNKVDKRKNTNLKGKVEKKTKKSTWKCKKCDYRNASKEALLVHVRKHSKSSTIQPQQEKEPEKQETSEVAASDVSISYRCGHCNQVSNWKHVIQRHCRLKHNGDVKVIVGSKNTSDKLSNSNCQLNGSSYDMKCSKCPFTTSIKQNYESHLKQHTITADSSYKCFICPYYVKTENELMQHLPLHGISEPEKYDSQVVVNKSIGETTQLKRYKCSYCPYESNSKSQYTYHEQFHKTLNAPFKCEVCNYQVTKRHLLHQHMRVHGFHMNQSSNQAECKDSLENDNSSVPSNNTTLSNGNRSTDPSELPLMWVSYNGEFRKMYKCRSCPYVSLKKNSIFDHEKMHLAKNLLPNIEGRNIHKCTECSYASYNLDIYLTHNKVHKPGYAKVLCPVNKNKSDEQQIPELKELMNELNLNRYNLDNSTDKYIEEIKESKRSDKKLIIKQVLFFCSDCPARFLVEKELQIHYKFHCIRLPYQCETCSYTARQHHHLMAHNNVHTAEYQDKTKVLQDMYKTHPEHPQPKIVAVMTGGHDSELVWIVVIDTTNKRRPIDPEDLMETLPHIPKPTTPKQHHCTECPAKFFKSAALNYHLTLHGGEGIYKCRQCNYAVKTIGNLAKHEAVHGPGEIRMDYDSGDDSSLKNVPISGTDLYHHKTKAEKRALSEKLITRPNDHFPPVLQADPQFGLLMHGNPDFIYPTYLKNGRPKEKRYKCHKCPSAFEKREQYKVHLSLHGSKQRYKCEICDYSVKYYANYVQHMRKHQMNADAQAARHSTEKDSEIDDPVLQIKKDTKLAIKSLPRQIHKDCSKLSISDQQTLKLLHRRRSSEISNKDLTDDRKIHRCTYCPYTNQRRDALDNHMRRHTIVSGIRSNFTCTHCDYAAPQSQFLRDHVKLHYHPPKHINPEYFGNFKGLEIFISKVDDKDTESPTDKRQLFVMKDNLNICDVKDVSNKIYVIPSNGERVVK